MSLFNRLEKLRARAEQHEEESVFGVTDLGPRSEAPVAASAANVETSEEAPKRRSPLEILQEHEAKARALKDATTPLGEASASSSLKARIEAVSSRENFEPELSESAEGRLTSEEKPVLSPIQRAIEEEKAIARANAEEANLPWPATPFKRPAILETEMRKTASEMEAPVAGDANASSVFASASLAPVAETPVAETPVEIESVDIPESSADAEAPATSETPAVPSTSEKTARTTAFDRLMAARSGERAPKPAPTAMASAGAASLSQRLAAMSAPQTPEAAPIQEASTENQLSEERPAPEIEPAQSLPLAMPNQDSQEPTASLVESEIVAEEEEIVTAPTSISQNESESENEIESELVFSEESETDENSISETEIEMETETAEPDESPTDNAEKIVEPMAEETVEEMAAPPASQIDTVATSEQATSLSQTPLVEKLAGATPVEEKIVVAAPVPEKTAVSPLLSLRERLGAQQGRSSASVPLPVAVPVVKVASAPADQETVSPAPLHPVAQGSLSMSDRFAARGNLDRLPVQKTSDLPPGVPSVPPSNKIDRTGVALALTEDGPASEREAANRALYTQKHLIFDAVLGTLDPRTLSTATKDSLRPVLERAVDSAAREAKLDFTPLEKNWMVDEFTRETLDLGPLVLLLEDVSVNKILVAGAGEVAIEKLGRIERTGVSFRDDDHLLAIVRRIAEMTGGRLDAKVPLLDRPLPDGARIRAKIPPLAPQPTLTIEKSTGNPFVALKRQQAERNKGEALPYSQLRDRIQQHLLREFETQSGGLANSEKLRAQVEEMINQVIAEERIVVTRAEKAALVMDLLNEIVGLGPLEPLLNDPDIDEIMVNGPYQIYVERKGKLELSGQRFRDNGHVMQVIDRIIAPLGRRIDEKSPMVDGRLRDGSRFNAIVPPLALGGPTMTIRKFARDPLTMTDLINFGSLSREGAHFLQCAVEGRLNVVVSGGTGSGKTTTLNVLSSFIPSNERIVTIEDAAELQLRQEHVIRLETRPPNIEGIGEISIRDLVRNSLRMRPDRIVIGECRGGEALDMLQAMNTGHDGSLTTGHSNGPRDTLKRLETMVMMAGFDLPIKAIREQIAMAVQLIVHQERMRDGKRRVVAITEVVGMEGDVITMQDLFRFEQERIDDDGRIIGSLVATGLRPKNYDTIVDNGVELPIELFQVRGPSEGGVRGRLSEHRVGAR